MKPNQELVEDLTMIVQNDEIALALNIARWRKFEFSFADFSKNATQSDDITIISLGGGGFIEEVRVVVSEIFEKASGVPVNLANLDVGLTASNPNEFINDANLKVINTSDAAAHFITDITNRILTENAVTDLLMKLDCGTDLTQDVVQGKVDVMVKYGVSASRLAP